MEINLGVIALWYKGQGSVYMLKGFRILNAKRK